MWSLDGEMGFTFEKGDSGCSGAHVRPAGIRVVAVTVTRVGDGEDSDQCGGGGGRGKGVTVDVF